MTEAERPKLRLESLHERHVGLTPALGGAFAEAASVCLGRHHASPVEFEISCSSRFSIRMVEFQMPDARVLNAWANEIDTTESGAYGLCLAAIEAEEELVAVRRAEKLTGADWYVAPIGSDVSDLESCYRLEVSGVDAGSNAAVDARLRQKVDQTRRGASNLPAIAAVAGFKGKAVRIQKVSDTE
jgi:hypothetical protein